MLRARSLKFNNDPHRIASCHYKQALFISVAETPSKKQEREERKEWGEEVMCMILTRNLNLTIFLIDHKRTLEAILEN